MQKTENELLDMVGPRIKKYLENEDFPTNYHHEWYKMHYAPTRSISEISSKFSRIRLYSYTSSKNEFQYKLVNGAFAYLYEQKSSDFCDDILESFGEEQERIITAYTEIKKRVDEAKLMYKEYSPNASYQEQYLSIVGPRIKKYIENDSYPFTYYQIWYRSQYETSLSPENFDYTLNRVYSMMLGASDIYRTHITNGALAYLFDIAENDFIEDIVELSGEEQIKLFNTYADMKKRASQEKKLF